MRVLLRFRPLPDKVALPGTRLFSIVGLLALLLLAEAVLTASAAATPNTRIVRYHGYRVTVPRAWPVYDLAADPTVCVRFNRHAVYLG